MPADSEHPAFQTQTTLRSLLDSAGYAPRKRYGQHFLVDRNLMEKLLTAAEVDASDCVLEVGTGTASLTSMLAERAGFVVTAEIDEGLARLASEQLKDATNVNLVVGDALARKSEIAPQLVEVVQRALGPGMRLKLVANLPYDVATPLMMNLLVGSLPIERMCFTVQFEVAERLFAGPGTGAYGPMSVLIQLLTDGKIVCRVPPRAFWPAPKVDSAMVRLDIDRARQPEDLDRRGLATFVREMFHHRRKTLLRNARHAGIDALTESVIVKMGLDAAVRPEQLTPEQWLALYQAVR